jgi:NAD(P)-dependent dehydrogenase (short-subunit alcohol dehydrogenase family)
MRLESSGCRGSARQGDLSIVTNIRRMYDVATNEFGRVDIVVNNAGYIKKGPLAEVTEEEFDRCAGITSKGLYFSMEEAAKRIADNGRIINIGKLVDQMNSAPAEQKLDATVAVINKLVQQRKEMYRQLQSVQQPATNQSKETGMQCCRMMQPAAKNSDQTTNEHSEQHR